jgi:lipid-A-disaccharide synthase
MKLGMVAGEASGSILGAGLIQSLRAERPALQVSGIGGEDMIAAGCESFYDIERLSVMGLVEPLGRLPELFRMRRALFQHFSTQKPDIFVGIDAPDFNLGLELQLRRQGVPVVHYVSPSVWAWRQKRIHKIARAVDCVLTLLPFEAEFYARHNVPATFVGHPLADKIPLVSDRGAARQQLGLEADATYIALLPGSRRNELFYLAELFLATARACQAKNPQLKFITSAANAARDAEFQLYWKKIAPDLPLQFFVGETHAVMAAADVILVTSGTATLEAMLFKRPMVIAYRMANLTYQIARHLVKIPHIGLPNLLAGQRLVPEFIQDAAQPAVMARALLDFLEQPEKTTELEQRFTDIHLVLRQNANQRAAEALLKLL